MILRLQGFLVLNVRFPIGLLAYLRTLRYLFPCSPQPPIDWGFVLLGLQMGIVLLDRIDSIILRGNRVIRG